MMHDRITVKLTDIEVESPNKIFALIFLREAGVNVWMSGTGYFDVSYIFALLFVM